MHDRILLYSEIDQYFSPVPRKTDTVIGIIPAARFYPECAAGASKLAEQEKKKEVCLPVSGVHVEAAVKQVAAVEQ